MEKMNACLKWSYITVTCVIGIISALLLAGALFTHGFLHQREEFSPQMQEGLVGLYVFSSVTLFLTIIGLFGACKKKMWALILFAVGMIVMTLLFFVSGVIAGLVQRPQVIEQLQNYFLDLKPLFNTTEQNKGRLNEFEIEFQCCGIDQGYLDWGDDIPASCICTESTNQCVAAPAHFGKGVNDQPIKIYNETCLPYILEDELNTLNMAVGIMMGFILLWGLSVALCIFILCRLKPAGTRKEPAVVYSAEAKAGNYSALGEATEI